MWSEIEIDEIYVDDVIYNRIIIYIFWVGFTVKPRSPVIKQQQSMVILCLKIFFGHLIMNEETATYLNNFFHVTLFCLHACNRNPCLERNSYRKFVSLSNECRTGVANAFTLDSHAQGVGTCCMCHGLAHCDMSWEGSTPSQELFVMCCSFFFFSSNIHRPTVVNERLRTILVNVTWYKTWGTTTIVAYVIRHELRRHVFCSVLFVVTFLNGQNPTTELRVAAHGILFQYFFKLQTSSTLSL